MDFKRFSALLFSLVFALSISLSAQTVAMSDNFEDGDAVGWTPDSADNWKVTDGVYYVYRSAGYSGTVAGSFTNIQSVWDDSWVEGDFTIDAMMGISPTAQMEDPDADPIAIGGNVYRRQYSLAFCFEDGRNTYMASFYGHNYGGSAIYKNYFNVDGADTTSFGRSLYSPVPESQGMGLIIQDLVPIQVARSGDVITVKRQGHIVYQSEDTTSVGP
ncbi:MAG: hypothetical protein JXQ83_11050, partial [Candidatus Glassbacteria bacterium]|nr:hypothetical protein [Candidatus Glassbacteria bacterium]